MTGVFSVYRSVADRLRYAARQMIGDLADTGQFTYTHPGQFFPSDISYDLIEGPPSMRQNEPWSKKRDIKKKFDMVRLGPKPWPTDALFLDVKGWPGVPPDNPKTDAQGKVKDTTKARGDEDQEELNRDVYRSVGAPGSMAHV
jgi:hypothetical protein